MNHRLFAMAFLPLAACAHAQPAPEAGAPPLEASTAEDGIIRIQSLYSVEETVTRLEQALAKRGIKVMAKVDHAANAADAGLDLAPTTLVIFGNPAAGTQLMQASRSIGIDLPMKALIYEHDGTVTLSYNAIGYIASRHIVPEDLGVLAKIESLLATLAQEATVE